MIHEVIVTTMSKSGEVHIAPMGIRFLEKKIVISPFRPSQTLDNILESNIATVNFVDDVRVFAGIVSRYKRDWDLSKHNELDVVPNLIIANTVYNLIVSDFEDDEKRPNIVCDVRFLTVLVEGVPKVSTDASENTSHKGHPFRAFFTSLPRTTTCTGACRPSRAASQTRPSTPRSIGAA